MATFNITTIDDKAFKLVAYGETAILNKSYNFSIQQDTIKVYNVNDKNDILIKYSHFSEFEVDGVTFNTVLELQEALYIACFKSASGGSEATNKIKFTADNYNDLSLLTDAELGDLSYVYNSQGTAWLPFSLGGTYYPKGWYIYNGSIWVSDRNDIANELNELNNGKLDTYQTSYVVKDVNELILIHQPNLNDEIELGNNVYYIDSLNFDLGVYTLISNVNTSIHGFSQNINKISSSKDNATVITSTGNLFLFDIQIESSGLNSQAIKMTGTGSESLDMKYVEFSFGTKLGELENLRQGFWFGGFAIGSSSGFLLKGSFGGFRISNSRLINIGNYVLKGDIGFTCNNIRSDANITIPSGSFAYDFDFDMFNNDGGYQISDGFYDGSGDMVSPFTLASGSNTTITKDSEKSFFLNNEGVKGENTKPKGSWEVLTEVPTVFTAINTFVKVEGITTSTGSVHFTQDQSNSVEYVVNKISDFSLNGNILFTGTRDNIITLQVRKINNVNATSQVVKSYTKSISNLVGSNDFVNFPVLADLSLTENDIIEYWVANLTSTNPITMNLSSESIIK